MIKCVRKIRILLLKVEECPDFSILQPDYPYVAPMEEMASNLKVWIFPNFCHFPWIFAPQQRKAPGFSGIFAYIRIFSSIGGGGGVRMLTGTTGTTLTTYMTSFLFPQLHTEIKVLQLLLQN